MMTVGRRRGNILNVMGRSGDRGEREMKDNAEVLVRTTD